MDAFGLLLLTILAIVSVVIVAVLSKKNKDESGAVPTPTPGPVPGPIDKRDMHKESEATPVSAPAVVLFEDSVRFLHRCPYCDGETALSAKCCRICGEKL